MSFFAISDLFKDAPVDKELEEKIAARSEKNVMEEFLTCYHRKGIKVHFNVCRKWQNEDLCPGCGEGKALNEDTK